MRRDLVAAHRPNPFGSPGAAVEVLDLTAEWVQRMPKRAASTGPRYFGRDTPEPSGFHESVRVIDVLRRGVEAVGPSAQARGHLLQLRTDLYGERVAGNTRLLDRVLVSLLADAVRSTAPGGTITLAGRCEHGMVVLSVRNAGAPGWTTAAADRLEPAREIARAHGGRIEVRPTRHGTTRTITLPLLAPVA